MNNEKPLISLITPCFNGEKHIGPYIKGILSQTYSNVQYIFINDGSTDNTENVILSYKEKILKKGWEFVYIKHKDNLGQSVAINHALLQVKGKYFSQIDSDDIIYKNFLEKYLDFLENHKEYKFCYAKVAMATEETPNSPYKIQFRKIDQGKDDLFEDFIKGYNVPALAFYMINTESFRSVVKLPIYESRGGQNWQILLPMAYHYRCGYINEVLATCIERKRSHSRENRPDRQDLLKKIMYNTISRINMPDGDRQFYYDIIVNRFLLNKILTFKLFNKIHILKVVNKKIFLFKFFKIGQID